MKIFVPSSLNACTIDCDFCQTQIRLERVADDKRRWRSVTVQKFQCLDTGKHKAHNHPDDPASYCEGRAYDMT